MNDKIRREHFVAYLRDVWKGDREAFQAAAKVTKGRVSQYLDPDQPFGERAARNLEDSLGLPRGFFSGISADPHPNGGGAARAQKTIQLVPSIDPLEMNWGVLKLKKGDEIPAFFRVAMPDDSLRGEVDRGVMLLFDRELKPETGRPVLVQDKYGERYIRIFSLLRGEHWRAVAKNDAFPPLDSIEDGLTVLATAKYRGW